MQRIPEARAVGTTKRKTPTVGLPPRAGRAEWHRRMRLSAHLGRRCELTKQRSQGPHAEYFKSSTNGGSHTYLPNETRRNPP